MSGVNPNNGMLVHTIPANDKCGGKVSCGLPVDVYATQERGRPVLRSWVRGRKSWMDAKRFKTSGGRDEFVERLRQHGLNVEW